MRSHRPQRTAHRRTERMGVHAAAFVHMAVHACARGLFSCIRTRMRTRLGVRMTAHVRARGHTCADNMHACGTIAHATPLGQRVRALTGAVRCAA
eukprot:356488-Chlamydomonas_euryale.AAC.10